MFTMKSNQRVEFSSPRVWQSSCLLSRSPSLLHWRERHGCHEGSDHSSWSCDICRTTKRPESLQRNSFHTRHCRGLLLWMENFCDKIRNHQQSLWSKQGVDYIRLPGLPVCSTKNVSSDVKANSRPQRGARGNWNYGWNCPRFSLH